MRILLDECVPRRLRRELPGHEVHTVPEMGWSGMKNSDLLQAMAERGFGVLRTVDQSVGRQQNLRAAEFAVLVLVAASNRLAELVPLMPLAIARLSSIKPGSVVEVRAEASWTRAHSG